jgi:hypothetical protein
MKGIKLIRRIDMRNRNGLFLILCLLLFSLPLLSQDSPASSDKEETNSTKEDQTSQSNLSKWYISLSGAGGNLKAPIETGTSSGGRFGFEYRPNPYIGFGLGLSASNYKLKEKTDPVDLFFTLTLLSFASRGGLSPYSLLLLSDSLQPAVVSFGSNTLDLAFNFHPNEDKLFDPYVGIGIIAGNCTGGASCTLTGGAGRAGLQINLSSFFFYLQGEARALNFSGVGGAIAMQENQGSIGLGYRF